MIRGGSARIWHCYVLIPSSTRVLELQEARTDHRELGKLVARPPVGGRIKLPELLSNELYSSLNPLEAGKPGSCGPVGPAQHSFRASMFQEPRSTAIQTSRMMHSLHLNGGGRIYGSNQQGRSLRGSYSATRILGASRCRQPSALLLVQPPAQAPNSSTKLWELAVMSHSARPGRRRKLWNSPLRVTLVSRFCSSITRGPAEPVDSIGYRASGGRCVA